MAKIANQRNRTLEVATNSPQWDSSRNSLIIFVSEYSESERDPPPPMRSCTAEAAPQVNLHFLLLNFFLDERQFYPFLTTDALEDNGELTSLIHFSKEFQLNTFGAKTPIHLYFELSLNFEKNLLIRFHCLATYQRVATEHSFPVKYSSRFFLAQQLSL